MYLLKVHIVRKNCTKAHYSVHKHLQIVIYCEMKASRAIEARSVPRYEALSQSLYAMPMQRGADFCYVGFSHLIICLIRKCVVHTMEPAPMYLLQFVKEVIYRHIPW